MPGLEDLLPLGFYLGEVLEFRAFRSMRSISVLDARYAPCLTDWLVSGVPSVPVSVILDLAVAAGRMIVPERGPALSLHEVRDIQVDLRALRRQRDCFTVEKEANGHMDGSRWLVDVQVTRADAGAGEPFARLQLVFAPNEPPVETVPLPPGDGTAADMPPLPGFSWRGLVYPPAHWTRATDGMLIGSVRETHGSDLWTAELPPEPLLPAAQLEAVLRAGMSLCGASAPPEHLFIAQLGIFGDSAACTVLLGRPPAQEWMAVDHEGRVGLRVTGLRCGSMDRRAAQSLV
jgi:hypothetical protein